MSIGHLNTLKKELPELFQAREISPDWHENWIVVRIDDPEQLHGEENHHSVTSTEADIGDTWETLESSGADWIQGGGECPEVSPQLIETFGGAHAGGPIRHAERDRMPPPDCFAFYLPFHYYHPMYWGVYLTFEGVIWLARELVRRSRGAIPPHRAIQAARLFLYHHEAFHHKTECFATRLELTHRRPFYKTGFERLYQRTFGTDGCLEEGLANASALRDSAAKLKCIACDAAFAGYVVESPPGYNQGVRIRSAFQATRCEFAEQNQNICLPHIAGRNPDIWRTAPHLFNGIANIKSRVNYLIPRNSPLSQRLPFRPLLPPNKLVAKLRELAGLEFVRHGGNHDIYRAANGKRIPIPRHPGDLGKGIIRKILSDAGVNISLQEFLQV